MSSTRFTDHPHSEYTQPSTQYSSSAQLSSVIRDTRSAAESGDSGASDRGHTQSYSSSNSPHHAHSIGWWNTQASRSTRKAPTKSRTTSGTSTARHSNIYEDGALLAALKNKKNAEKEARREYERNNMTPLNRAAMDFARLTDRIASFIGD